MMLTDVEVLRQNIEVLPPRDRQFANDLLSKPSTPGRREWLHKLAERVREAAEEAVLPAPAAPAETVENVAGIVALIERGGQKLRHPKIAFQAGSRALMLSIAGDRARHPGTVNVTDTERGFDNKTWFGRIHQDGRWDPSHKIDAATAAEILVALREFADDPAGVAKKYGRLTGGCCFCGIALTDQRSIDAGYGPTCASNYGLPWG